VTTTVQTVCAVVELRQYTLHPGARDALIELFDREFLESQEAVGMSVIGQFRDLDDPDRFVWLRGFPDMATRARALQDFYGGPVWAEHRDEANATMIDSSDVLLLRPARPGAGFTLENVRPAPGADEPRDGIVTALICHGDGSTDAPLDLFERVLQPAWTAAGATVAACFVTDSSPNTFPALPVREGENVVVWFSLFEDCAAHDRHVAALARSREWRAATRLLNGQLEVLRLSPTARSRLGS
jgi:quinol monooxygenase YgiN